MKYSLKSQYKHLIKEEFNEPDPVINTSRDLIKIEFPGDPLTIARYYNVKNAKQAKDKERFLATKDSVIDLGIVSIVDSGIKDIVKSNKTLTKKQITKSKDISINIKKLFIKSSIDFINNYIVNSLVNLSNQQDFDIINKIDNCTNEMYLNYVYTIIPTLKKVISTRVALNPTQISNKDLYSLIDADENNSEMESIFIDILEKINVDGDQINTYRSSELVFKREDFVNYKKAEDTSNSNLCFKKYLSDRNDSNDLKISTPDFLSNEVYIKDFFDFARDAIKSFINFNIDSNETSYNKENFVLQNIDTSDIVKAIAYEYCENKTSTTFISDLKKYKIKKDDIRKSCNSIEEAINHLNKVSKKFLDYKGKGGSQGAAKGAGEFHVHMFLRTTNACLDIEPDAILSLNSKNVPCSIKAFETFKSTAQTGTTLKTEIKRAYDNFISSFIDIKSKGYPLNGAAITGPSISDSQYSFEDNVYEKLDFVYKDESGKLSINSKKRSKAFSLYKEFKSLVGSEHDAEGVITYHPTALTAGNNFNYISKEECKDLLTFSTMPSGKRIGFSILPTSSHYTYRQRLDTLILMLLQDDNNYSGNNVNFNLQSELDRINKSQEVESLETSSYKPRGKVLKEVYSHLFKNKLISEGGKAGHMMHPYENLHMKISDMKRMIEDFQNDFEISEKVDGANLFFTVNSSTGQVLFSRNKADMSYQETLDKFGPDHPAHILFNEGTKSIFNAIQRSLNMEEVRQIFGQHPEGGKTYINFEIMHPKKPNQIKYDMKWIVFHAIVDFDINGEKVLSSSDDPRLLSLIEKLQPYFNVYDNDFNLGSNFKIKLNSLSSEDVNELLIELESITRKLGISDEMTIADAIKSEIMSLLDRENLANRLSSDKIDLIYNFITDENSIIKGTEIKKGLDKEVQKALTDLGLTSKTKAYKIIKKVISDFKPLFILLGIKLLHNVQSRYMSSEASEKNVNELRRLLIAAIEDYNEMLSRENLSEREIQITNSLESHVEDVNYYGIDYVVSSPVEGGVFIGHDGNTYKVTGGFAPLNQILGTAMRNLDSMPRFKQEFLSQERGN